MNTNNIETLCILQQNTHKSRTAQLDVLNNITTNTYDIILIQEPHIDHLNLMRATSHWKVIYPSRHDLYPQETRTITLISTKVASNKTQQLKINSSDITVNMISTSLGIIDVYNIYLDGTNTNRIIPLINSIESRQNLLSTKRPKHTIWAGDFN